MNGFVCGVATTDGESGSPCRDLRFHDGTKGLDGHLPGRALGRVVPGGTNTCCRASGRHDPQRRNRQVFGKPHGLPGPSGEHQGHDPNEDTGDEPDGAVEHGVGRGRGQVLHGHLLHTSAPRDAQLPQEQRLVVGGEDLQVILQGEQLEGLFGGELGDRDWAQSHPGEGDSVEVSVQRRLLRSESGQYLRSRRSFRNDYRHQTSLHCTLFGIEVGVCRDDCFLLGGQLGLELGDPCGDDDDLRLDVCQQNADITGCRRIGGEESIDQRLRLSGGSLRCPALRHEEEPAGGDVGDDRGRLVGDEKVGGGEVGRG